MVVHADTKLDESSADNVTECEDRIVSQWREISADERHQLRGKVDGILRPLGLRTRLLVVERDSSIALYFTCLTLSAVMGLRDQWSSGQLKDIVESLFTLLSGATHPVRVKGLTWPQTEYERCMEFYSSAKRKQNFFIYINQHNNILLIFRLLTFIKDTD